MRVKVTVQFQSNLHRRKQTKMVNIKFCVLFLFIGSTYFINECRAQKPDIVYLSRFLFRLGRSFIQPGCPPKAAGAPVAAMEEPDDYDEEEIKEGLALFEPSPPTLAAQPTTTESASASSASTTTIASTEPIENRNGPDQEEEATEAVTEIATEAATEVPEE